jgi:methionine--tRNA ligase beta chain
MDLDSWGGNAPDGRAVKGTLHWVSAAQAISREVRLYDRLFNAENPGATEGRSFLDEVNPDSLERITETKLEPYLATVKPGDRFQFERIGYFYVDPDGGFNRTVTLKDTWAKIEKKQQAKPAEKKVEKKPEAAPSEIGIEEFAKIDLRVGRVMTAEVVPEANKLLKLQVDLGEGRLRQIFAGLRAFYPDPGVLVGKNVIVVANLKPRQMKFGLSEGMVLAAGEKPQTLGVEGAQPGDKVS